MFADVEADVYVIVDGDATWFGKNLLALARWEPRGV
jgi:hypothetical protein